MAAVIIGRLGDHPRVFAEVLQGYVLGLDEGAFAETRRTPNGDESCAYIEVDGEIVGFATFYQPDHRPMLWLDLLWIWPNVRRAGHATALIEAIVLQGRTAGMDRVELGTWATNTPMRNLLQRFRFWERGVLCELKLGAES